MKRGNIISVYSFVLSACIGTIEKFQQRWVAECVVISSNYAVVEDLFCPFPLIFNI